MRGSRPICRATRTRIDRLLDRLERAGFTTLVVTGDTPVLGNREHNTRSGFSMPMKITPTVMWQSALHPQWLLGTVARTFWKHGPPHFENTEAERGPPMLSRVLRNTTARDKLSWRNLEAIRRRWKGPLLVKGLQAPADAVLARECGADGVIISNHGGRQLDYAAAPLDVLPEIAAAKGDMTVILDSGVRRGTDVLKALALGADFVFVGPAVPVWRGAGRGARRAACDGDPEGGDPSGYGADRGQPAGRIVTRASVPGRAAGLREGETMGLRLMCALAVQGAFDGGIVRDFEAGGEAVTIDWAPTTVLMG